MSSAHGDDNAVGNASTEAEMPAMAETSTLEPTPPPLTPAEFSTYNALADKMNLFHNHFRRTWVMLHTACTNNKRPAGMSIRQFINEGLTFVHHLTAHHDIEETYFFPMLARKMPEFKKNGKAELLQQHRQIHAGMDLFEEYLEKCLAKEVELDLRVLKEKMDSWGDVLWKHLDQEVLTLGAENMRKYWTLQEMTSFPI